VDQPDHREWREVSFTYIVIVDKSRFNCRHHSHSGSLLRLVIFCWNDWWFRLSPWDENSTRVCSAFWCVWALCYPDSSLTECYTNKRTRCFAGLLLHAMIEQDPCKTPPLGVVSAIEDALPHHRASVEFHIVGQSDWYIEAMECSASCETWLLRT
jgi:hypothetical protein